MVVNDHREPLQEVFAERFGSGSPSVHSWFSSGCLDRSASVDRPVRTRVSLIGTLLLGHRPSHEGQRGGWSGAAEFAVVR